MKRTKEELLAEIERQKILKIETDRYNYDKLFFSEPEVREIERLETLIVFHDLCVDYEEGSSGFITIKRDGRGDILYALRTGRWKVVGRRTWYYSGKLSIKEFVDKYVLTNHLNSSN